MHRYHVGFGKGVNGWVIWDHKLGRFIGDGKGNVLTLSYRDQALDVIDILVERVGA